MRIDSGQFRAFLLSSSPGAWPPFFFACDDPESCSAPGGAPAGASDSTLPPSKVCVSSADQGRRFAAKAAQRRGFLTEFLPVLEKKQVRFSVLRANLLFLFPPTELPRQQWLAQQSALLDSGPEPDALDIFDDVEILLLEEVRVAPIRRRRLGLTTPGSAFGETLPDEEDILYEVEAEPRGQTTADGERSTDSEQKPAEENASEFEYGVSLKFEACHCQDEYLFFAKNRACRQAWLDALTKAANTRGQIEALVEAASESRFAASRYWTRCRALRYEAQKWKSQVLCNAEKGEGELRSCNAREHDRLCERVVMLEELVDALEGQLVLAEEKKSEEEVNREITILQDALLVEAEKTCRLTQILCDVSEALPGQVGESIRQLAKKLSSQALPRPPGASASDAAGTAHAETTDSATPPQKAENQAQAVRPIFSKAPFHGHSPLPTASLTRQEARKGADQVPARESSYPSLSSSPNASPSPYALIPATPGGMSPLYTERELLAALAVRTGARSGEGPRPGEAEMGSHATPGMSHRGRAPTAHSLCCLAARRHSYFARRAYPLGPPKRPGDLPVGTDRAASRASRAATVSSRFPESLASASLARSSLCRENVAGSVGPPPGRCISPSTGAQSRAASPSVSASFIAPSSIRRGSVTSRNVSRLISSGEVRNQGSGARDMEGASSVAPHPAAASGQASPAQRGLVSSLSPPRSSPHSALPQIQGAGEGPLKIPAGLPKASAVGAAESGKACPHAAKLVTRPKCPPLRLPLPAGSDASAENHPHGRGTDEKGLGCTPAKPSGKRPANPKSATAGKGPLSKPPAGAKAKQGQKAERAHREKEGEHATDASEERSPAKSGTDSPEETVSSTAASVAGGGKTGETEKVSADAGKESSSPPGQKTHTAGRDSKVGEPGGLLDAKDQPSLIGAKKIGKRPPGIPPERRGRDEAGKSGESPGEKEEGEEATKREDPKRLGSTATLERRNTGGVNGAKSVILERGSPQKVVLTLAKGKVALVGHGPPSLGMEPSLAQLKTALEPPHRPAKQAGNLPGKPPESVQHSDTSAAFAVPQRSAATTTLHRCSDAPEGAPGPLAGGGGDKETRLEAKGSPHLGRIPPDNKPEGGTDLSCLERKEMTASTHVPSSKGGKPKQVNETAVARKDCQAKPAKENGESSKTVSPFSATERPVAVGTSTRAAHGLEVEHVPSSVLLAEGRRNQRDFVEVWHCEATELDGTEKPKEGRATARTAKRDKDVERDYRVHRVDSDGVPREPTKLRNRDPRKMAKERDDGLAFFRQSSGRKQTYGDLARKHSRGRSSCSAVSGDVEKFSRRTRARSRSSEESSGYSDGEEETDFESDRSSDSKSFPGNDGKPEFCLPPPERDTSGDSIDNLIHRLDARCHQAGATSLFSAELSQKDMPNRKRNYIGAYGRARLLERLRSLVEAESRSPDLCSRGDHSAKLEGARTKTKEKNNRKERQRQTDWRMVKTARTRAAGSDFSLCPGLSSL
ncbi:conserved hypothetical protein [Neospora caninum Liverpool]|uniref:PH domain-containing protein n=1 Tax=Neospora caninum (strain Liverpool) TaxID=572307 RepID=F0V8H4_NEOCL|nr:conserved hypothetical protein [Neospora caninum Liverpool]CBZ50015.1 conserved hypothetical protein [Neospora caninum Liverpool]CEL64605.1 TPA: hypothetical protein BN1204_004910 [Neospora caninum Liverpool]|eukprot:XP_003880050.1 conserved hypothetical protein [Neospora caninum Liverpool]